MTIQEFLTYIGQTVIIIGAVNYLVKSLGEFNLEKKIKTYEKEQDNHRALLENEFNLFLGKSSKQLLTMKELYKKVATLRRKMSILILQVKFTKADFDAEEKKRISYVANAYNDFISYYAEDKLVLSKKMTINLDKLTKQYYSSFFKHSFGFQNKEHYYKGYTEGIKTTFNIMNNDIPPVLTTIEDEFRS